MRKVIMSFLLSILALMANIASGEVVDKIAVVVNNEVITQREIDKALESVYEQFRTLYYGDELVQKLGEARRKVIDQLIDDRLILSEAKKTNVEVDEKDVEARVSEVAKNFPSKADFEKALSSQNLSMSDLKKRYRDQLMQRKLIDSKVGSKITISPVEIQEYYSKHSNDFVQPEAVSLSNILIRPKKDMDSKQALSLARDIIKRLKEGCGFAGLAKEYSDGPHASEGGAMGWVKKGDLLPEIEAKVFNMKSGEISDIIQTSIGYHIFKLEEKRERKVKELAEVRREVEEMIFHEKAQDKIKSWVDGLRKHAYIEFK